MRRLRRWLRDLALSSTGVRELLARAGEAIREAKITARQNEADALMSDELHYQRHLLKTRMHEMLALREAEVACFAPDHPVLSRESARAPSNVSQFKERLWELELALEDRGWVREVTTANLEFSRHGVGQLIRIVRVYAIKNPLIKRGAEICKLYVFGRGVEIRSEDPAANDVVQEFIQNNQKELGHIGLAEKETALQTDGAQYFGMVTENGGVRLLMVDALEIMDVITDKDDTSRVLYYLRQWSQMDLDAASGLQTPKPMKAAYPSLEMVMDGEKIEENIGQYPVNKEMPIYRMHGGGSPAKWRWPVPPLYASIDWARAYKDFLEDWATVQRALARFALMVETKGGPGAIAAYQALLSTTFADSGTQIERNPTPSVGSAHITGDSTKITPFKSQGATDSPEQARRLLLMTAASHGMPETFYGDASTGSLATAVSLDRPTELKFREMQQRWTEAITFMLRYVLLVSKTTPGGRLREARQSNPAPQPVVLIVKFPAVLEHDIALMVKAWADVATLGGRTGIPAGMVDRRTVVDGMLGEVGLERRTEALDAMGYGDGYDPKEDILDQRTQVSPQQLTQDDKGGAPGTPPPPKPKEALVAAVDRLREAAEKIGARNGR